MSKYPPKRASKTTAEEMQAIASALPARAEFNSEIIKSIARKVAPRLSVHQLDGLPTLLRGCQLIEQGRNRNWYRLPKGKTVVQEELPTPIHAAQAAPEWPPLREASNAYTKDDVVRRFKEFYIREYGKMDNKAYTICGYLLEALD